MKRYLAPAVAVIVLFAGGILAYREAGSSFVCMWLTPAQQYQRLVDRQDFIEAAARAVDPLQKGAALYLAGEFRQAAAVYGTGSSAEALYNRGNSLVMQGQYEEAVAQYQQALKMRPDWREAEENMDLARLRKEKMAPPENDAGGTGGELAPDEIVIGDRDMDQQNQTAEAQTQGRVELSENEQLALWLRKVETKPADFLRLKFEYQFRREGQ